MKKKSELLAIISILLSFFILHIRNVSQDSTVIVLYLLCFSLGLYSFFVAIYLLIKKKGDLFTMLPLFWGSFLVCVMGLATLRIATAGLEKYMYPDVYATDRVFGSFKCHVQKNDGVISFDDNWREILMRCEGLKQEDFVVRKKPILTYYVLNQKILDKNISEIEEDQVVFFEVDNQGVIVGDEADLVSQDYEKLNFRNIVFKDGRIRKYFKGKKGYTVFGADANEVNYLRPRF